MRCFGKIVSPSRLAIRCGSVATLLAAMLVLTNAPAFGYQTNSGSPGANRDLASTRQGKEAKVNVPTKTLPDSRVAELRDFAQTHHAEILPLLNFLETKRPKRFQKVMAKLDRSVSNLERLRKRSPEAYQRGLATWINQSQIQLYAAQFKVAADDKTAAELREKIRRLVEENLDARVSQIEEELSFANDKITRLQKVAEDIKANREAMIEKKTDAATKHGRRMNKAPKKPAKPAAEADSVGGNSAEKTKSEPKK